MKSEALKELKQRAKKASQEKHPNVPAHALPVETFSTTTANGLTKAILAWLKLNGHKAWRQGSEGRYRPGQTVTDVIGRTRIMKGSYLPGQNNGAADVCAIIEGRFTAIEVKIGRDKQSDLQKQYEREVIQSGGLYWLVNDFDQFMKYYKQLTK